LSKGGEPVPDFTYEVHFECAQVFHKEVLGSKGDKYIVTFGRKNDDFDFDCTCPASKYRVGHCKHIKSVMDQKCNYHTFVSDEEPIIENNKHMCPRCGSELVAVRVAV
jgi:hypothetical protein